MHTKKDTALLFSTLLDHFESALYGFLAPIMAPLFFPAYAPAVQLILAYSVYATSLFARPFGSYLFGILAREKGPSLSLAWCQAGIAITSLCIAFLPIYATIGWLAPAGLIILRTLKSICSAGHTTIAKLYCLENKEHSRAFTMTNLYESFSLGGIVLASFVATLMVGSAYAASLWRLGYGITSFIGISSLFFYTQSHSDTRSLCINPLRIFSLKNMQLLWTHRISITRIALVTGFSYITYTVPFVFMATLMPLVSSITYQHMMFYTTVLLVFDMILIPLIGRLVLPFDPQNIMRCAALVLALTVVPLFYGLEHASWHYTLFVRIWIIVWGVVFLCPRTIWKKSICTTTDHYFIIGMGSSLGAAAIGRTAPAICLSLWYFTHSTLAPAGYLSLLMVLTVWALKE